LESVDERRVVVSIVDHDGFTWHARCTLARCEAIAGVHLLGVRQPRVCTGHAWGARETARVATPSDTLGVDTPSSSLECRLSGPRWYHFVMGLSPPIKSPI
jgi:hypothetical protein